MWTSGGGRGKSGSTWWSKSGMPLSSDGADTDKSIDPTTGDCYSKSGGVWSWLLNLKGPKGDKGDPGTNGTSGVNGTNGTDAAALASLIGTITLSESALVAISAGVRKLTVSIAGTLTTGNYLVFPTAATPTGYALHDSICSTNGQLTVSLTAPLLAIGASYSITCRVVRINT